MAGYNPLPNMIFVADTHCGCGVGLFPPYRMKLDQGGWHSPSRFQRKIYAWWREMWDEWVPMVCRGEPFGVCLLGDAMDGRHHDSVTQITQNLADQQKIAVALLEPVAELCKGNFWMVRGTEAHTGPSAENEERLAEKLKAIPDEEGLYARYVLWKYIGKASAKPRDCALVNALHHIGVTGSQQYESTAPHRELVEAFTEAGRWGNRPPDAIVRAHRHRNVKSEVPTKTGRALVVVCPGWQGKVPFAYRIGSRQSEPQFGGVCLRRGDEPGEKIYERHFVRSFERPKAE